jgi:LL-diaminopimelate aminotransferase
LGVTTAAFAPLVSTRSSSASSAFRSSTTTARDMIARNPNFAKLAGGYLFPEIGRRRNQYVADHPELASKIISLGIGDTTLPIPPHILSGLTSGAAKLGTASGYSGYGDVQGRTDLRAKIAETLYAGTNIEADEVFVSGTCLFWSL